MVNILNHTCIQRGKHGNLWRWQICITLIVMVMVPQVYLHVSKLTKLCMLNMQFLCVCNNYTSIQLFYEYEKETYKIIFYKYKKEASGIIKGWKTSFFVSLWKKKNKKQHHEGPIDNCPFHFGFIYTIEWVPCGGWRQSEESWQRTTWGWKNYLPRKDLLSVTIPMGTKI